MVVRLIQGVCESSGCDGERYLKASGTGEDCQATWKYHCVMYLVKDGLIIFWWCCYMESR